MARKMNKGYCEGCKWLQEDSLSCEIDYYFSCQNEKSDYYLGREEDIEAFTKEGEKCPDKKLWTDE